jgi:hypothetical protein
MTEFEWEASDDAPALLAELFPDRGHDSAEPAPRKLRLYYAACARLVWPTLPRVCRELVEFAEGLADGAAVDRPLRHAVYEVADRLAGSCREDAAGAKAALADARERLALIFNRSGFGDGAEAPPDPWAGFAQLVYAPFAADASQFRNVPAGMHATELVRDVFRYPTGLLPANPGWRTETVLDLARPMYEARDFTLMPILGDALEDAGFTDRRVLLHCRRPGPHVRGCWVVDLVLGKR